MPYAFVFSRSLILRTKGNAKKMAHELQLLENAKKTD